MSSSGRPRGSYAAESKCLTVLSPELRLRSALQGLDVASLQVHKDIQSDAKELFPCKKMGNLIMQKLFGGGGPMIKVETQGACSSQCCEEVVSESSDSPTTTHPSRHAASSFGTIPPEIENICEYGT